MTLITRISVHSRSSVAQFEILFLGAELDVVKLGVEAAGGEQGVVSAALGDGAVFDDEDYVRAADGGEAVGDDDCCST